MKGQFTESEAASFQALEAKKAPIQAKLDELKAVVQADDSTNKMVRDARAEIFETQKGLVPLAEMQAGLASPTSRDKYFPDMSKKQFIEHVKGQV
ncbi:MAG: hypothetical protein JKY81_04600 [Colwellia sp.]|nr:hypothetical protein [Colwellia sp.]